MKKVIFFCLTGIVVVAGLAMCAGAAQMAQESRLGPTMTEFTGPEQQQASTGPLFKEDGKNPVGGVLDTVFNKVVPDTVNTVGGVIPSGAEKAPEN